MQTWDELLRVAMLGSDRAGEAALPTLPEPLAALLADNTEPPEARLLHAAALLNHYRRLGTLPAPATNAPAAASAETLPACTDEVAALLRGLLGDEEPRLLMELLGGMAALPCLAPPETLPDLLDLALTRGQLLAPLRVVGGERLRWLAAQHRQWSDLLGESGDDPWLSGNTASRAASLRDQRRRDPEAARARLAAGFAQESARDRQALLECLEVGLGVADTAFLEACLEDRSQAVRQQAVRFLLRLGDNPTTTLVRDTVAGMVGTEGMLRKKLRVNLPEAFDKDWTRLGLREKPPAGERIGQRTFWLAQWLGLLGPSRLAALLNVDLDTLSGLIKRSDFARELQQAMAEGAEALRDVDYARWRLSGAGPKAFPHLFASLGGSLPTAQREALLADFLRQYMDRLEVESLRALLASVGSLSAATTQVLVAGLESLLQKSTRHPWSRRGLVELADYLSVTEAQALKALCQAHGELDGVNEFWRRYEWRCRIHQALRGSAP